MRVSITMTAQQLHDLLGDLEDTHEVVITRAPVSDVAFAIWRAAEEEADLALCTWQLEGGGDAYAAYRASADRADAAAGALDPSL